MTKLLSVLLAAAAISTCGAKSPFPVEEFTTPTGGKVQVYMIHHGSIALSYRGFNIQVDPVAKMGQNTINYSSFPKADLILVTHEHGDHLDPDAIAALSKPETRVILNPSSQAKLGHGEAVSNGDTLKVGAVTTAISSTSTACASMCPATRRTSTRWPPSVPSTWRSSPPTSPTR